MRVTRQTQIKHNLRQGDQRRRRHPGHSSITTIPTTPAEGHRQAAREAQEEYAPTIRQIKGQIRGSGQRQQDMSSWYGQLDNTINQSAAASAAAQTAANAALAAQANGAANASLQNQAAIAGQNADFAKLSGADPSAFAQGTQTAAAAANQRQMTNAALAAPIINSGVTQAGYFGAQRVTAGRDAIYQRLQEGKRRESMKQDLLAAKKERAGKAVSNFGRIKQEAIDNVLKRQAFGLESKEAQEKAVSDARSAATASRNAATSERSANQTAADNRREREEFEYERKHGTGSINSDSSSGKHEHWNNAQAAVKNLYSTGEKVKVNQPTKEQRKEGIHGGDYVYEEWSSWDALAQAVAKESEVSPAMARRAVREFRKQHEAQTRQEQRHASQDPNGASLGR
jgi:hypothetical protein